MSVADALAATRPTKSPAAKLPTHVVLLTNFIPPYRLPVYSELADRVEKLTILLSTPMEPNRSWQAQWGSLDVRLQRTWTVRRRWRHAAGFTDTLHVHVPVDTLGQLKALRPDVIISAELGSRSLLSTAYASRGPKTPIVLWLTLSDHTEQGRGRLRHVLRRWLLARADAVVVNGASGARYVERFGFDRGSIFRVPYTALPDLFEQIPAARAEEKAHRLLYVGQLIERKGLGPFITALADWASSNPQRDVSFDLVGSGPLREELESIPLPGNLSLHFLGERSYEALGQVYAEAGIFAFPTLADEWGLVVNEAMSAGLPVLGSVYSQAVEELCRDGINGWTFRPDSRRDMVGALNRALSTSAERLDAMRARARADVAYLTPRHAVDRLMGAIEHASNVRGGRLR
jgi:glycosyltransferase involved in cell wall biosynthesis